MQHIGIDIIEIPRIERAVRHWGSRFLRRVFTRREVNLCHDNCASLAARFAGKEAVMKALNTPLPVLSFRDIEILSDSSGRPVVHLHGPVKKLTAEMGISGIDVSLSHSRDNAVAMAITNLK